MFCSVQHVNVLLTNVKVETGSRQGLLHYRIKSSVMVMCTFLTLVFEGSVAVVLNPHHCFLHTLTHTHTAADKIKQRQ